MDCWNLPSRAHICNPKTSLSLSKSLNIAVLGGGESGVGAALLAKRKGHHVFVSDAGSIKENYIQILSDEGIDYEQNHHSEDKILATDLVVKSPGIPEKATLIQNIRKAGIELISEIEWAYRYCPGKIIGITGSNGKTTTAMLTYEILKNAGLKVHLAGNIGLSFAACVNDDPDQYYVVEISSFQLDDIKTFTPHIAILTNITPDHLDRYNYQMELYVKSKFSITKNQNKEDYFIYCNDDEETLKAIDQQIIKSKVIPFSLSKKTEEGAWLDESNHIQIKLNKEEAMSINELALQGKHNTYNSMAAGLASKLLSIRKETIRESLSNFDNIEHRLEPVLQIYGIEFINDSKATNINSSWYALDSMSKPTILILGGVDKGNDYSQLFGLVKEKVKAIICLGTDTSKIHDQLEDKVPFMIDSISMNEAVRIAFKLGEKGDTVLLSPACASFDLFENYEDRGRQFKNAVRGL